MAHETENWFSYPRHRNQVDRLFEGYQLRLDGEDVRWADPAWPFVEEMHEWAWQTANFYEYIIENLCRQHNISEWSLFISEPNFQHYFYYYGCYPIVNSRDIKCEDQYTALLNHIMGDSLADTVAVNWAAICIMPKEAKWVMKFDRLEETGGIWSSEEIGISSEILSRYR